MGHHLVWGTPNSGNPHLHSKGPLSRLAAISGLSMSACSWEKIHTAVIFHRTKKAKQKKLRTWNPNKLWYIIYNQLIPFIIPCIIPFIIHQMHLDPLKSQCWFWTKKDLAAYRVLEREDLFVMLQQACFSYPMMLVFPAKKGKNQLWEERTTLLRPLGNLTWLLNMAYRWSTF